MFTKILLRNQFLANFPGFLGNGFWEVFRIYLSNNFENLEDILNQILQKPFLNIPKNPPKTIFENLWKNLMMKILGILEICTVYFEVSIT